MSFVLQICIQKEYSRHNISRWLGNSLIIQKKKKKKKTNKQTKKNQQFSYLKYEKLGKIERLQ